MTAIVTTRLIAGEAKLKARADTLVDFTVARVHGVCVLYVCVSAQQQHCCLSVLPHNVLLL